ncbi:MAG: hypothetical protein U1E51_17905, partial [Candidatus Binatia bacterium]|nr:hypothetical protein [Candidatus Binatia bacterium]
MEGKMTVSRRSFVSAIAAAALFFPALSHAQSPSSGSVPAGESQITLRKSVQSREYQGNAVEGEERTVGPGDSLWRILIQERGLPEKRFQSYLVVIRGLNPQVKNMNVLRVGDAIFIPLRPDEVTGAPSATTGSAAVPQPLSPGGTTVNYRVKAGEHLYQILRQQLGLRDEQQVWRYYALTKDLNRDKQDWDVLLEGETIRLPTMAPVQEAVGRRGIAAPESTSLAETRPPAVTAQTAPASPTPPTASPPSAAPETPSPALAPAVSVIPPPQVASAPASAPIEVVPPPPARQAPTAQTAPAAPAPPVPEPPAVTAQTAPVLPAAPAPAPAAPPAPPAQVASVPAAAPVPAPPAPTAPPVRPAAPVIDMEYARRLPAVDGMALLAGVVENLGAQLQRTGEEVVAVKDSAVRLDRSKYPVVYNPTIRQRVVIDTGGNIPESL